MRSCGLRATASSICPPGSGDCRVHPADRRRAGCRRAGHAAAIAVRAANRAWPSEVAEAGRRPYPHNPIVTLSGHGQDVSRPCSAPTGARRPPGAAAATRNRRALLDPQSMTRALARGASKWSITSSAAPCPLTTQPSTGNDSRGTMSSTSGLERRSTTGWWTAGPAPSCSTPATRRPCSTSTSRSNSWRAACCAPDPRLRGSLEQGAHPAAPCARHRYPGARGPQGSHRPRRSDDPQCRRPGLRLLPRRGLGCTRGLDPDRRYCIVPVVVGTPTAGLAPPSWYHDGTGIVLSGRALAVTGLRIPGTSRAGGGPTGAGGCRLTGSHHS